MPFTTLHTHMQKALSLAHTAMEKEEVPVGALVVHEPSGDILASAHNIVERILDPTAHAELLVLQQACKSLGSKYLKDCTLYVTLEPCAMCAQAMAWAKLGTLVYGAADEKSGGVDHGPRVFHQPTCHHRPQVIGGILEKECAQPLKDFFDAKRAAKIKL